MATLEEIVITYVSAWAETDEGVRRALLKTCWADEGIYSDPTGEAVGREALLHHIAGFLKQSNGYRILCTSGADEHHSRIRFTWALVDSEGRRVSDGIDFGEVGPDGRLTRITGFFGPPPTLPASWPADLTLSSEQANGKRG
ncbi:nuclear transport factor 2 family protein [Ktedonosporobacter rubrisoli]|uniref:Nuclear transport factor 2 family protein n=1 Tax=Ktedonosporobacter rubrisoli TaxID=2509675 RepID=A0A4V0YZG5_KTERU|nr:nuclear transport factor 2 family protein [Ktedonosporobacter rubrisoli]QBD79641.1 nuclear transport factor 2 family protein [Ktedonosporobacter rubrisoli]